MDNSFRLSCDADKFFEGITYINGEKIVTDRVGLQRMFKDSGFNESFARISVFTALYGVPYNEQDPHSDLSLEYGLTMCRAARDAGVPIKIELTFAEYYMDISVQQAPNFKYYPNIYALQKGKEWQELSLEEMEVVVEAYAKFVSKVVLDTGVKVSCWDLGNEANLGFAGIGIGLKSIVSPKLEKQTAIRTFMRPNYGTSFLKKNCWCYAGRLMAAAERGIKASDPNAKFSTHIATLTANTKFAVDFFNSLRDNGCHLDYLGLSIFPSVPTFRRDLLGFFKKLISTLIRECGVPVFIAEYAYPARDMKSGSYKSWNKTLKGYPHTGEGQAKLLKDLVAWGRANGVAGIHCYGGSHFGSEYWGPMGFFDYDEKTKIATARPILKGDLF